MSKNKNCVECGKEINWGATDKNYCDCVDPRIHFCWIQEARGGRSNRYWDAEKQVYVYYEDDEE